MWQRWGKDTPGLGNHPITLKQISACGFPSWFYMPKTVLPRTKKPSTEALNTMICARLGPHMELLTVVSVHSDDLWFSEANSAFPVASPPEQVFLTTKADG